MGRRATRVDLRCAADLRLTFEVDGYHPAKTRQISDSQAKVTTLTFAPGDISSLALVSENMILGASVDKYL